MLALRIALITLWIFCIALESQKIYMDIKYPPANKLKRSNGMIHHPTFGDYPEEIQYYPGVSIMPGQVVNVHIPAELFEKGKQN